MSSPREPDAIAVSKDMPLAACPSNISDPVSGGFPHVPTGRPAWCTRIASRSSQAAAAAVEQPRGPTSPSSHSRTQIMRHQSAASLVVISAVMVLAGGSFGPAPAAFPHSASTTLYFLRHGETQRRLVGTGPGTFAEVCTPNRSCCETPLNPLGVTRRDALARVASVHHGIAKRLTHLIATNKPRTVQTLTALGIASGLGGDQDGDGVLDGADDDLVPGDGIQQFPAPRPPSAIRVSRRQQDRSLTSSMPSTALPPGSRAVVANHSETLHSIITETTGIDTERPRIFPKEDGSTKESPQLQLSMDRPDARPASAPWSGTSFSTSLSESKRLESLPLASTERLCHVGG